MRNLIGIIIPYFGHLPNYFDLWLESVKYNSDINVIFLTDIKKPKKIPTNLIWENISFNEVKKRAQKLVSFNISLSRPYKLTDFRPAYGQMFSDYLENYDWWGFGDVDTIWGNLDPIIEKVKSNKFDKVLSLGHLTLLKNSKKINSLYRIKEKNLWNYKEVFSNNNSYHFDEGGGLSFIARAENCQIYDERPDNMSFADVNPNYQGFTLAYSSEKDPYIFRWKNGNLQGYYVMNNRVFSKDFTYVHLQKRSMKLSIHNGDTNDYLIVPNAFIPFEIGKINAQFIKHCNILKPYFVKRSVVTRIFNRVKFSNIRYLVMQKVKKIPVNGNEVYFKTEKPKY
ncbi:DUF6625 family protein [Limosilactobacillus reuteri subsp. suis]|uniref:DUF6625 family protein n=1 Tax=Limosilactobacillus reuteri TaxID=1598 RepID=UPI00399630BC